MILYACQKSKKEGFSYIILKVDNDNTDAERLYKKLVFIVAEKSFEKTKMKIAL